MRHLKLLHRPIESSLLNLLAFIRPEIRAYRIFPVWRFVTCLSTSAQQHSPSSATPRFREETRQARGIWTVHNSFVAMVHNPTSASVRPIIGNNLLRVRRLGERVATVDLRGCMSISASSMLSFKTKICKLNRCISYAAPLDLVSRRSRGRLKRRALYLVLLGERAES
jgi:hypothetical protein